MLKVAQVYFTVLPLAFASAIFFAPKEFMAAYRATAIDPVPAEGTPAYDMLVLVMKWWAFALASNGVATMTIAAKGDEAINKIYIRTSALFSGLGGLGLTYVNLEFANKMNAGADGADPAPTDMGPIYFNVGLQVFGLVLGLAATAGSKGHGHSHGHAHADKKEEEHHGHGHDEDGNCMDHGHGHDRDESPSPHGHGHGKKKD